MTTLYIIIGILLTIFLLVPLVIKSNAIYCFLLLAAGELASRQVSVDATKFLNSIFTGLPVPMYTVVQIFILLFGSVTILFVYKRTAKAKEYLFNIIVGLSASLIAVFLVVAKLPYESKATVESLSLYSSLENFLGVATVAGLLGSLFYFIFHKGTHITKHDKKHK